MAQIIISLNNQLIKRVKLVKPQYVIGRGVSCDIQLPDRTVSNQHARLLIIDDDCFLEDLGSTNSLLINNQHCHRYLLKHNDTITLGKYTLVFQSAIEAELTNLRAVTDDERLLDSLVKEAKLEYLTGRKQGQMITVSKEHVYLGTADNGTVSIRRNQRNAYQLEIVDDQNITSIIALKHGDQFNLGEVTLRFHLLAKSAKLEDSLATN